MTRPAPRVAPRGIDLVRWWPDLRALVKSKYGRWLANVDIELEDVLGETAQRILVANEGAHPFDPALGEPQLYLLRQARSAIKNLLPKRRRWARDGLSEDTGLDWLDRPSEQGADDTTLDRTVDELVRELDLDGRDRPVVRLYLEGHTRTEIASFTGSAPSRVADLIRRVRHAARVGR